jgi:phosphoribosyl 1,2-cyclic phosphate phosphodiesterase
VTSGCGRPIYLDVPSHAKLLVDTSPDLRQQALVHELARVDAVLFTHSHADHILGLDELRRFNAIQGGAIPCYANVATWETLRQTFSYIFDGVTRLGGGIPELDPHEIAGPFAVGGVHIVPVSVWHGLMPVFGFRFGTVAYLTDCNRLDDSAWESVDGVDRSSSTRSAIAASHALQPERGARRHCSIKPRRAFTTHMTHDLGHARPRAPARRR